MKISSVLSNKNSGVSSWKYILLSLHCFVRIFCRFKLLSIHTLGVQTIHRSPKYHLQNFSTHQRVYNNLKKLEGHVTLIPSSRGMCYHACKILLIQTLDQIAKEITSMA
jgi:hypothetical protein